MPVIKNDKVIDGETLTIYIEVDRVPKPADSTYEDLRGPADRVIEAVRDVFGDGLQLAGSCARRVVQSLDELEKACRPDEFEVQLSIKLDSEVGVPTLVKLGSEAQMQVTMKWVQKKDA